MERGVPFKRGGPARRRAVGILLLTVALALAFAAGLGALGGGPGPRAWLLAALGGATGVLAVLGLLQLRGASGRVGSGEWFADIVERSPAAVYVKDRHGRYLFVNETFLRQSGRTMEQVLGHADSEWLAAEAARDVREADASVLRSGLPVEVEEHVDLQGEPHVFQSHKFPLPDREGRPSAVCGISVDVTRHRRAETRMRGTEMTFRSLVERALVGVYLIRDGRFVYVNPRLGEIFGRDREQIMEHCGVADLVAPGDRERVLGNLARRQRGEIDSLHYEFRGLRGDGGEIEVEVFGSRVNLPDGPAVIGTLLDVTARRRAEEQLRLAARAMETTVDGVIILDREGRVVSINDAVTRITGYAPQDVIGRFTSEFRSERHARAFFDELWKSVREEGFWQGESWYRRKDGASIPVLLSVSAIRDHGETTHHVAVMTDLSRLKRYEEQLEFAAYYDSLTGLANRRLLERRVTSVLDAGMPGSRCIALVFLDVDDFKSVNDSLGHSAGDELLTRLSRRLQHEVRPGDIVARPGGDEFIVFLNELRRPQDASLVTDKLLRSLARPTTVAGRELFVSASAGISCYPADGSDIEVLMRNADTALSHAKSTGRGSYRYFSREMNEQAYLRLTVTNELRHALAADELVLYYQPVLTLGDRSVAGLEALVRWNHPRRGMLAPSEFIPVAEQSGQIGLLGEWVLRRACRDLHHWATVLGDRTPVVSVNLAPEQFREADLPESISRLLREEGVTPQRLSLEITETTVMREPERARKVLQELRSMGMRVAIDDFGTGHSSLSYLKDLPVDSLKIDRSFVRDLPADTSAAAIVRSVMAMAKELGLTVIAEGIESEEQLEFLRDCGCRHGQGFLFARPEPEPVIRELLAHDTAS